MGLFLFTQSSQSLNHPLTGHLTFGIKFAYSYIRNTDAMNVIQAILTLKNGTRKYGSILSSEFRHTVLFVPGTDAEITSQESINHLIQYIPVDEIESIDTYLK